MDRSELGGVLEAILVVEAVNSVALAHRRGCICPTCRAAGGTYAALYADWAARDAA